MDRFLAGTIDLPKVLLTNGDRTAQNRKIDATGLRAEFLEVITPADAGAWKPDPRVFEAGLAALRRSLPDLKPDEVLMVGDDLVRDIEPARALGMAVWPVASGTSPAGALSLLDSPVAARMAGRFADDPAQAAVLRHRSVVGSVVCDHETVTRTLSGQVVEYDLLATYQVTEGRIVSATFAPSPPRPTKSKP